MQTQQFNRKSFPAEAVRVSADNMAEVAKWSKGEVKETDPAIAEGLHKPAISFIKVDVKFPHNERQTQAFVGDWVLYFNKTWKVFTDQAFKKAFEPYHQSAVTGNATTPMPKPKPPVLEDTDIIECTTVDNEDGSVTVTTKYASGTETIQNFPAPMELPTGSTDGSPTFDEIVELGTITRDNFIYTVISHTSDPNIKIERVPEEVTV